MANIEGLVRHILKWECGASQKQLQTHKDNGALFLAVRKTTYDPKDKGGWTNSGITLGTWKSLGYDKDGDKDIDVDDLRIISYADWLMVLKKGYWGKAKADQITSQSVANMIVDWMYTSGGAAKQVQKILGVTADGVFGPKTIAAINSWAPYQLFNRIRLSRLAYYRALKDYPRFGKGWENRTNDIKFQ